MSLKVILPPRLPSFTPTKIVSMKQEIDIHVAALKAYDAGEYEVALQTFGVSFEIKFGLTDVRRLQTPRGYSSIWE
jgi:hypothetical protein